VTVHQRCVDLVAVLEEDVEHPREAKRKRRKWRLAEVVQRFDDGSMEELEAYKVEGRERSANDQSAVE
jgi:hypothetical protein